MKKALLAIAGVALVAGLASVSFAQDANSVDSANAVGVVKYTIPANGQLTCISLPLDPMSTNSTWYWTDTQISQALPRGSYIYCWRNGGWATSLKQKSGWTENFEIQPGEAFFVKGNTTSNLVVSLLGELPVEATSLIPLTGSGYLDMTTVSMYPVAMALTNSAFADMPRSTYIYRWNGTGWDTCLKQKSGWTEPNWTFGVGEGVYVKFNGTATNVVETRPFNW